MGKCPEGSFEGKGTLDRKETELRNSQKVGLIHSNRESPSDKGDGNETVYYH